MGTPRIVAPKPRAHSSKTQTVQKIVTIERDGFTSITEPSYGIASTLSVRLE